MSTRSNGNIAGATANVRMSTGITRRRVLASGATLAAGVAGLTLVGCGDDDGPTSTPAPSGTNATSATSTPAPSLEKPVKGGTLRMGRLTDIILTTGWPLVNNAQNLPIGYTITEPLVRYRDSLVAENVLAERFEYSSDKSKVTITLKQGATFHNGAKVTPDDVFFGIDLMLDPKKFGVTGAFALAPFAKFITDRKKVDERTMEFMFDRPRVNMTDFFAQMHVTHAASYEDLKLGKSVQGTGPFAFKSWTPKEVFRLEANPNWHGTAKEGGPWLDAIESRIFPDETQLASAFAAGGLDLVMGIGGSAARQFRDKKQTRLGPKVGLIYTGCVVTNPMLKDARVRQALFLGIDRKRLVEEVGQGFSPITAQTWPAKSPAFDKALEAAYYDPAKAKELLKVAAFTQDRPLKLEFSSALWAAHAAILRENWDAIGVKVDLVPTDPNEFLVSFNARKFTDLFISSSAFSDLSPLTLFQQAFPYRIPNLSYYGEPGSDSGQEYVAIIKELESLDPASTKAKEVYSRFNKLWLEQAWLLPMLGNDRIELVADNVRGADEYFLTIQQQLNFAKVWKKA